MKKTANFSFVLLLLFALSACTPTKKYKDMEMVKNRYQRMADSLRNVEPDNSRSDAALDRLSSELTGCEDELNLTREKYTSQVRFNDDLQVRFDELLEQNKLLLNASSSDIQNLTENQAACQVELDRRIREVERLKSALASAQNRPEPEPIIENCDQYRARVDQLNGLLAQKDQALLNLKTQVNKALLGFSDSDISVSESNGKIYVSLSQGLLYKTGSDQLDWKGKKAIQQLANLLKVKPDINIMVEGHTDSSGSADKNWDLSVRRATSVVKVLTANGVDPKRVTASGRALYAPVASNGTSAGKAANRRTEIILTPNLDELYRLINN